MRSTYSSKTLQTAPTPNLRTRTFYKVLASTHIGYKIQESIITISNKKSKEINNNS